MSFFAGATAFYQLPPGVDPEMGPINVKVTNILSDFVTHSEGFTFMVQAPGELPNNFVQVVNITIDD